MITDNSTRRTTQEARDELRTCRNAIFQDPLGFRHVELQVMRIEDIMYYDESGHELANLKHERLEETVLSSRAVTKL